MKLLITGGAGFIGSNFVQHLNKTYPHYKVVIYDLLTYAGTSDTVEFLLQNPANTFMRGDINDESLVVEATKNVDVIVHFAAESHVDRAIVDPTQFLKTNVLGTATLLRAARGNKVQRFHHVSTDEVFGALGEDNFFSEASPYAPRNPYSASKAGSDHLVRAYYHTYGLPITISNCSNNYGPRQFPEKIIPLFITNLMQSKKVPVYGEGKNVRDWIHVDDHSRALDMIVHSGRVGETYCIGGDTELRNTDLTMKILNSMHQGEAMITYVPDRRGHDYRYAMDSSKIKTELGWKPQISFDTGLASTITWYQEHEGWWKSILDGSYLEQNDKVPYSSLARH